MRARIDTGMAISACVHAGVLLWAAVSFAARPLDTTPTESMPVDIISMSEFTQLTAGSKSAPQKNTPKPLVEKKAEPKPVETPDAQVSDKPEVNTSASAAPPPAAAEPPPAPAQPRPVPQQAAEKPPEKSNPDAESLKKAEKKEARKPEPKPEPKPAKKPEPKKPDKPFEAEKIQALLKKREAKKPADKPEENSKFEADKIQALLDKRQPRRLAATGDVVNTLADRGSPRGTAATLTQNEIDALRARITQCWNVPVGATDAQSVNVLVRIRFNKDGSLSTAPVVMNRGAHASFQTMAESAVRAITRCAPYSFMPVAKYETWKDIEVNFDPRDLFRG